MLSDLRALTRPFRIMLYSALALQALGLTTWDVPSLVSALTASVFLLGLVVFARKQLTAEIRKLFSA